SRGNLVFARMKNGSIETWQFPRLSSGRMGFRRAACQAAFQEKDTRPSTVQRRRGRPRALPCVPSVRFGTDKSDHSLQKNAAPGRKVMTNPSLPFDSLSEYDAKNRTRTSCRKCDPS